VLRVVSVAKECALRACLRVIDVPRRHSAQAATVWMVCAATQRVMDSVKRVILKARLGHVRPHVVFLTAHAQHVLAQAPVSVSVTERPVPTAHTLVRQPNVALLRAPKVQPPPAERATAWVDVLLPPRRHVHRMSAVAAHAAIRAPLPVTASPDTAVRWDVVWPPQDLEWDA
jgi:hypothetical protein